MLRFLLLLVCLVPGAALADRLKDLADVAGVRSNPLVGYGLVVGLNGSGDGNSGLRWGPMIWMPRMRLR